MSQVKGTPRPGRPIGALALLLLAGCGARGEVSFNPEAGAIGTVETVLVSTSREATDGLPLYSAARAETHSYAAFRVAVPPDREAGTVKYPRRPPGDPRTDFLVVDGRTMAGESEFVRSLNEAMRADPAGRGEALLFVHGFNTNFAEALYRKAQLRHDLDSHAASVLFSWPSASRKRLYLYDRESVLYSRDALMETIRAMTRSEARHVNLMAHSMGALLLMDTLWMMAHADDPALRRIENVVLLSPDIELDVFRRQAPPVLARNIDISVFVSSRDRALRTSAFIRGERDRLGSISSTDELGGLDVHVIDLSAVDSDDALGHFSIATSPALIGYMRGLHAMGLGALDTGLTVGPLQAGAVLIQQGTNILLEPLLP